MNEEYITVQATRFKEAMLNAMIKNFIPLYDKKLRPLVSSCYSSSIQQQPSSCNQGIKTRGTWRQGRKEARDERWEEEEKK